MKTNLRPALAAALLSVSGVGAQETVSVRIHDDAANPATISREIYGQFAEHLGSCIYGGIWVGPDSDIPNEEGYRLDVLGALRELHIPVLRWPGGCFADEYHWRDGIGPREERPRMVNSHWGGTVEDNSFGTHEFLNLCEKLGCEPYVSGNLGSGTPAEMGQWIEYMTAWEGPMAELRRRNGRSEPWRVKYFGIGNESWGCGGNMRPEYYADLYRQFATYCRNHGDNRLYKIACGPSDYDFNWTEVLMKRVGNRMDGLSLHYYTVKGWEGSKGSATEFSDAEYYATLDKALGIEPVIRRHEAIMAGYDPAGNIGLLVDEWGTWFDVEPGTNPGHLFQQNTLRDAMVAALSLHVFHRHAGRVRMANIAQMVNVLQAMILTRGGQMVLTPTYHLFRMYRVHQGAEYLPTSCDAALRAGTSIPAVSATASRDAAGTIHLSLVNPDLTESRRVVVATERMNMKSAQGELLTAARATDCNDFGETERVAPRRFDGFRFTKEGELVVELPARSIVTLALPLKTR